LRPSETLTRKACGFVSRDKLIGADLNILSAKICEICGSYSLTADKKIQEEKRRDLTADRADPR